MGQGIDALTAAQLSNAAYSNGGMPSNGSLPAGWTPVDSQIGTDGNTSFTAYVNNSTQQVVFAFRGSDNVTNFESDLTDAGASEWETIKSAFDNSLANIQQQYAGYEVMTDGHSLGGGFAQVAALENGLSGYGQNSLPVPSGVAGDPELQNAGGISNAINNWNNAGNTFAETNTAGDPATITYQDILGMTYLNTSTNTIQTVYTADEVAGAIAMSMGDEAGIAMLGEGAYESHSITTVVAALQDSTSNGSNIVDDNSMPGANVLVSDINSFNNSGDTVSGSNQGNFVSSALMSYDGHTDSLSSSNPENGIGQVVTDNDSADGITRVDAVVTETGVSADESTVGANVLIDPTSGGNTLSAESYLVGGNADTVNLASNAVLTVSGDQLTVNGNQDDLSMSGQYDYVTNNAGYTTWSGPTTGDTAPPGTVYTGDGDGGDGDGGDGYGDGGDGYGDGGDGDGGDGYGPYGDEDETVTRKGKAKASTTAPASKQPKSDHISLTQASDRSESSVRNHLATVGHSLSDANSDLRMSRVPGTSLLGIRNSYGNISAGAAASPEIQHRYNNMTSAMAAFSPASPGNVSQHLSHDESPHAILSSSLHR